MAALSREDFARSDLLTEKSLEGVVKELARQGTAVHARLAEEGDLDVALQLGGLSVDVQPEETVEVGGRRTIDDDLEEFVDDVDVKVVLFIVLIDRTSSAVDDCTSRMSMKVVVRFNRFVVSFYVRMRNPN